MTTRVVSLVGVVAAFCLGGCGDDGSDGGQPGAPFTLLFDGTGFAAHDGQTLWVAVVREDLDAISAADSSTILAGAFHFSFADLLQEQVAYHVDYYADVDDNGRCEPPPTDHVWRALIPPVTNDVSLGESDSPAYVPQACASF